MRSQSGNVSAGTSHNLDYGRKGFSVKSLVVALLLSAFLVASSSYIALRLGALPWPIIFSVVAGAGILRIFGKFTSHELNVAHAGASVGGLVASALVFTVPAFLFLRKSGVGVPNFTIFTLMLIVLSASLLGLAMSVPLRKQLIDVENLPFPSGTAGAKLILAGFRGGFLVWLAFFSGVLAAVFSIARDLWFPTGLTLLAVPSLSLVLSVYPMPLAVGVGYILKPKAALSWFAGSVLSSVILVPFLSVTGVSAPAKLGQNLGMGLLFGAGLALLVHHLTLSRQSFFSGHSLLSSPYAKYPFLLSLASVLVLHLASVPLLASVAAVLLTLLAVFIAARMTGETNIDPLEQFGIIVGISCVAFYSLFRLELSLLHSLLIVIFASVAAAIAGDVGHDYKAARIVGTRISDILRVDVFSAVLASLLGPLVLAVLLKGFSRELFTSLMPAPQSQLVASALNGFAYPSVFFAGLMAGFIAELVLRKNQSLPFMVMPFAIGLFLGFSLGFVVGIGGVLSWYALRKNRFEEGVIAAAGVMGGEGIVGFSLGALGAFGFGSSLLNYAFYLFIALFLLTLATGLRKKYIHLGGI